MFFLLFVFTFECYCFAICFLFLQHVYFCTFVAVFEFFYKGDIHKVRIKCCAIRKPKANKLIDVEVSDSSGAFTDDFEVEKHVVYSTDGVVEIVNPGSNVAVSIFLFCWLSSFAISDL